MDFWSTSQRSTCHRRALDGTEMVGVGPISFGIGSLCPRHSSLVKDGIKPRTGLARLAVASKDWSILAQPRTELGVALPESGRSTESTYGAGTFHLCYLLLNSDAVVYAFEQRSAARLHGGLAGITLVHGMLRLREGTAFLRDIIMSSIVIKRHVRNSTSLEVEGFEWNCRRVTWRAYTKHAAKNCLRAHEEPCIRLT